MRQGDSRTFVKTLPPTSSHGDGGILSGQKSRTNSEKSFTHSFSSSDYDDTTNYEESLKKETPKFGAKLPVVLCILFTEMCERLVYYGISGNLLLFLKSEPMSLDSAHASTFVLLFTGVSYFVPIFGGWLADSVSGKYNTLYGSLLIYFVGTALLPAVAYDYPKHIGAKYKLNEVGKRLYCTISMLLVSIGTGGIKANVAPFGAEQVQSLGPAAITVFFNWFYWFINVGSFVAFTFIVYVQTEYSFFYGYLALTVGILIAAIILISGRKKYTCMPPNGSIITDIFKIIFRAIKRRRRLRNAPEHMRCDGLLDYARVRYGGPYLDGQVDTVLALLRILPIMATLIIYWTIYFQMQTSFLLQGLGMDLYITKHFSIPPASLSLFDIIIILLLIPFMDRVFYPMVRKLNIKLKPLRKMGIGMIFAAISLVIAANIEVYRRKEYTGKNVTIAGKIYKQSDITIFYQVPQFLLIGTSEVFTVISGLEFSYAQSPKVLQGVVMGLFLMTSGLGSFLGSALIQIVNAVSYKLNKTHWYNGDDINKGKLDYFFYILTVLIGIDFLVFCAIAARYTYVSEDVLRRNEDDWSRKEVDELNHSADDYVNNGEYSESD